MNTKKTKIVATIGPASSSEEMLTKLVKSGMNMMRMNFSHDVHEVHAEKVVNLRKVCKKLNTTVAILQDLSGPKIRTGDFYQEKVTLKKGDTITLTTEKIVGDEKKVSVTYKDLPKELKKGDTILLDDGRREFKVLDVKGKEIKCKIIIGGEIKGRRGVNLPGVSLNISSLTTKDREDIPFGIKHDVDFFALSFVRRASDITELRNILKKNKSKAKIISKIETFVAIENIDEIITETDGVMVARGDLAVEVGPENVPVYQKMIIKKCNKLGKPVIVATQMLESMICSPVPTRAEISDIANSVFDGADAIMLSEETSLGQHPEEAVAVMKKATRIAEKSYPHKDILREEFVHQIEVAEDDKLENTIVDSITFSTVLTAREINAKAIVALTESGYTARMISRFRPKRPVIVMSPYEKTVNQLALSYSCYPTKIKPFKYVGQAFETIRKYVVKNGFAKKGDKVVITAGMPFGQEGGTNLVTVLVV